MEQFQSSRTKFEIGQPPHLKIFFFLLMNLFWERPMRTRTNGKRGNSIYYTWKTFFKATRQKGRSNTDFFLSLKIFFFYWWTFFWERPMSPRTNGKRENSIYYTWQIFFKATRQKGRSKTDFFLSLKIFFFLLMNLFWNRPMSPRTNGKRGNSMYYTWKTFFKATRQKGRSNSDFYKIFFYQTLSYCLSFFS